jgi:hypothetical protein
MTIHNWAVGVSGDWNTGSLWSPAGVPNTAAADVTIDAAATLGAYTVTIASGTTETVNSLSMNAANNFNGTFNPAGYLAAKLELDGTLVFAAGSAGRFDGSPQTFVHERAGATAAILNGGTLNASIQAEGTLLLAGTNTVYISNEIAALGGTVTIAAPLGDIIGNTLTDGIFAAHGLGAVVNLGNAAAGQIVAIATVAGETSGWAELTLDGANAAINEWNGSSLVAIETTLRKIGAGGTVDILGGRDYIANASLTLDNAIGSSFFGAAMLNLQAGRVAIAGGITINDGIVQGYGTIDSSVVNNGTLIALGGLVHGTLEVIGSLTGTGIVTFDRNASTGADATEASLRLHGVSAGQTITLNDGGDTLILATPSTFAGTIVARMGGSIILQGLTATTALLSNGTLFIRNGGQIVAALALAGSYAGDSFVAAGSIVTVVATPAIGGAVPGQAISDQDSVSPFAGITILDSNAGQTQTVTVTLSAAANGTLTNLGGGTYNASTGIYSVTGAATAVSTALAGLVFIPKQHQVTPGLAVTTRFTISDIDTASKTVTDSTTTVITTAGTVLPAIGGTAAGLAITDRATVMPFAGVVITDANFGQTETVTVTLSDAADGTLASPAGGTYDGNTGVYTIIGTAAVVTAAVRALVFTPALHAVAPGEVVTTGFTIFDTDTASQFALDRTTTVLTTATASLPTIDGTVAEQAIGDQEPTSPFAGVAIADANFGQTESVTVTLSTTANGTLTNLGIGNYNSATGVYSVTGDAGVVTSALQALLFTPHPHQVAPGNAVTTNFTISDIDTAAQSAVPKTVSVTTTAIAASPTIIGAGLHHHISDQGTIAPFADVTVADANFGQTQTLTVSLSDPHNGTFTGYAIGIYDPGTGEYRVTGTAAEVAAALRGLVFIPTPHQVAPQQTVTTTFTINDSDTAEQSVTDSATTVDTFATTVQPSISGAAAAGQLILDRATVAPFAQVVIEDANFGQTETLTVTLSTAANGTLTAFTIGTYDPANGVYTVTGTAAAVTAALDALVFAPNPHLAAPGQPISTRFRIDITDSAGQTGTDSTTTVLAIVTSVSPSISGATPTQAISDQAPVFPFADVLIADVNVGQTQTVTVTLSAPANGTLLNLDGAGGYDSATGIYTVIGSADAVTIALNRLVFIPTVHQVTPGQSVPTILVIHDTDTALQIAIDSTTTVIATAGIVQPTISGAAPHHDVADQQSVAPFAGITIADGNPGQTQIVTVTLSAPANGRLTNLGTGTYDIQTGFYSVTGTASAVTTAVAGLLFIPTLHQVEPGQAVHTRFTILDIDTASQTATDNSTTVTATAEAVAPTIAGTAFGQATSDLTTMRPFAQVVIADANLGQTETVTVTPSTTLNGVLTDPTAAGIYNPGTGTYTVTGTTAFVTAALQGLVFIPNQHLAAPGRGVITGFTIRDSDTAAQSVSDSTTTVVITVGAVPPSISATAANQAISDRDTTAPFAHLVLTDANLGQTETVRITLSSAANGILTNLGGGTYDPTTGIYSVTGTASSVTDILNALVFIPTLHQVAPGQAVITRFIISDIDTALQAATDSATTVVATAGFVPPVIAGTRSGQAISDQATIRPFAQVVIGDTNPGQIETVTVILSRPGNGTLTNLGGGAYNTQTGVYSITGSAQAVSAALAGWIFTPTPNQVAPGQLVTTTFTIGDTDTAAQTATDATTSVITTALAVPPTITGTTPSQAISDQGRIAPFAHVVIADANFGQTETVTVALSAPANGILSNLGGGTYSATTGVYTVTGTAAAVTAAVAALIFLPQPSGVPATTSFAITVTDTAGAGALAMTTTVKAMPAAPGRVILNGSSSQFVIADNGGALFVQDPDPSRAQPVVPSATAVMDFANGVGLFDPTGTAEDVARLYQAALNRAPDVGGLQAWTADIDIAKDPMPNVANGFVGSPEFIQNYGALSDRGFVQRLYQNVLKRDGEPSGVDAWAGLLAAGGSRGDVLLGFAQSAEFKANMLSIAGDKYNAEAYRLYVAALNRVPEPAGLAAWAAALASGMTPTQAAEGFVSSQEFLLDYGTLTISDFVTTLYRNVLHRAGDPAGQQAWTNALQQGASRAGVLLGFSDSLENRIQTAGATHANWVFIPS